MQTYRSNLPLAFLIVLVTSISPSYSLPANDVVCSGCVGTTDISNNAILSSKIKNGEIKNADLANHSITSIKIKNGDIRNVDLANDAITSIKIKNGSIRNADLAINSITSSRIKNGEVKNQDLANNAVTFDKLSISLQDSLSASAGVARTIEVSGNLTPVENATALHDAITFVTAQIPSASDPWVIKLDAGTFYIGNNTIIMPKFTKLEGAGMDSTFITGFERLLLSDQGKVTLANLSITSTGGIGNAAEFYDEPVILDSVRISRPNSGHLALLVNALEITIKNSEILGNGKTVRMVDSTAIITNTYIGNLSGGSVFTLDSGTKVTFNHSAINTRNSAVLSTRAFSVSSGKLFINHSEIVSSAASIGIGSNTGTGAVDISIKHSTIKNSPTAIALFEQVATSDARNISISHSTIIGGIHGAAGGSNLNLDLRFVDIKYNYSGVGSSITNKTCLGTTKGSIFYSNTCP